MTLLNRSRNLSKGAILRIKIIRTSLLAILATSPIHSHADLEFKRPLQSYKDRSVQLGAEYSYFDLELDFLDYASRLEGRSTPERNEALRLDVHLPIAERISIDYQRSNNESEVSRTEQPFKTIAKGFDHQIEAGYWLFRGDYFSIFIHGGLKYAKQEPVEIDCYNIGGGVVVGGNCEEADFRLIDREKFYLEREFVYLPVITTDANSIGFKLGATLTNKLLGMATYQYVGFEQTEINVRTTSGFLDIEDDFFRQVTFQGRTIGDLVDSEKSELPQEAPWLERTYIFEAGAKHLFRDSIFATGSLAHYFTSRDGYLLGEEEEEYQNNSVLNLALWYQPNEGTRLYIRGEASSNNVLGFEPIAYNRKSSRYFKHPFGQLSVGFTITLP